MDKEQPQSTPERQEVTTSALTLQELVDALPLALIITDVGGEVLFENQTFHELIHLETEMFEYPTDNNLHKWFRTAPDSPALKDALTQTSTTGQRTIVSGHTLPEQQMIELHIYPMNPKHLRLIPMICGESALQHYVSGADGDSDSCHLLWILVQDVTQERVMEQQLRRTERLASIGELSANLAHELNSPIDGALRYTRFLIEDLNEDDPRRKYALYAQDGLLRMARIVKGLLYFSHQNIQSMQPIDIHQTLTEILSFFQDDLEKQAIRVEKAFAPELPVILYRDLEHVFLNLIKNAIQAMPDGGTLRIQTKLDQQGTPAEQSISIEIHDTGHGIPWSIQDKIFTPFFTTKDVGEGTGLGLSISRGIVERYHGEMQIESHQHHGTTATVKIPVAATE